ncbi:hypothetical protein BAE44_0026256 [Dichanthelium oligosanthes]|uniref:Uncharacterized protein n=1 Tax=Dichanthelium oligosanthes TaxID=888268 RepID=A0A1E5UIN0_9POAL|nr:hypothetical protein BAE44_0026256 [Dichanthelium oligosanthes]
MAARWKVMFQLRTVEVAVRCVRARGVLADAAERLASPMHGTDAQDVRAQHELVRSLLTGVFDVLALAASSMKAAELFALYGAASANPMLLVLSIQHIPDGNHPVRLALGLLHRAPGLTPRRRASTWRAVAAATCGRPTTCSTRLSLAWMACSTLSASSPAPASRPRWLSGSREGERGACYHRPLVGELGGANKKRSPSSVGLAVCSTAG